MQEQPEVEADAREGSDGRLGDNVALTYKEAEQVTGVGHRSIASATRNGKLQACDVQRGGRTQKGVPFDELLKAHPGSVPSVEAGYRTYLKEQGLSEEEINQRVAGMHVLLEESRGGVFDISNTIGPDTVSVEMVNEMLQRHELELQLERERTAHEQSARELLQRTLEDMRTMLRVENAQLVSATRATAIHTEDATQASPFEFLRGRNALSIIAGVIAGASVAALVSTMIAGIALSIFRAPADRWFAGRIEAMERSAPAAASTLWARPIETNINALRELSHAAQNGTVTLNQNHTRGARILLAGYLPEIRTRVKDMHDVVTEGGLETGRERLEQDLEELRELEQEIARAATNADETAIDEATLRKYITWLEAWAEFDKQPH